MKKIVLIILLFTSTNILANDVCLSDQNDLNKLYTKLLNKYKNNKVFVKNLIDSQKKWQSYINSQIELIYGSSPEPLGSVWRLCIKNDCKFLVNKRIDELKYLESSEEYDVCSFEY